MYKRQVVEIANVSVVALLCLFAVFLLYRTTLVLIRVLVAGLHCLNVRINRGRVVKRLVRVPVIVLEWLHRGLLCLGVMLIMMVLSCLLLLNLVLSSLDELFDILVFDLKLHFLVPFRDLSFHLLNLQHLLKHEVLVLRCPVLLLPALLPAVMRCACISVATLRPQGLHVSLIERVFIVGRPSLRESLGVHH